MAIASDHSRVPANSDSTRNVCGNRQILFGGMGRLTENSIVSVKNKSHAVTAERIVPPSGAAGVIIAQGGSTGGWCL